MRQTHTLVLNKDGMSTDTVPEFKTRFERAYVNEIEYFIADVVGEREPSVNLEDGIGAVELAFAANKALKTRMPVDI
jgi:scyllo-inositol 2-dehydrogenase (NAD+)